VKAINVHCAKLNFEQMSVNRCYEMLKSTNVTRVTVFLHAAAVYLSPRAKTLL